VKIEPIGKAHRFYPAVSIDYVRWIEVERIVSLLYGADRASLLIDLIADPRTPRRALVRARQALERRLASAAATPYLSTGSTRRDARSAER
jgi:hypothetical protein